MKTSGQFYWVVCVSALLVPSVLSDAVAGDHCYWQGTGTAGNSATDPADPTTQWLNPDNWLDGRMPHYYAGASFNFTCGGRVHAATTEVDYLYIDGKAPDAHLYIGPGVDFRPRSTYIGYYGIGHVIQEDGIAQISASLGSQTLSWGTYDLLGGSYYGSVGLGAHGEGKFNQSGGLCVVTGIAMGSEWGGVGQYTLSDGRLVSDSVTVATAGRGTFLQTGGTHLAGSLKMGIYSGGMGEYILQDGALIVPGNVVVQDATLCVNCGGTGAFDQTGGTHQVEGSVTLGNSQNHEGTYNLSGGLFTARYLDIGRGGYGTLNLAGGTLLARSMRVGPSSSGTGTLNITSPAAHLEVRDKLTIGDRATVSAVAGAAIHMTDADLENKATDPAPLVGMEYIEMIFDGGPASTARLEVAGRNLGVGSAAFHNNFMLRGLTLGERDVGYVQLVDQFDNQPDWDGAEALYVLDLQVGPNSVLDLNGLDLYYLTGSIDPQANIILNGGHLGERSVLPDPASLTLAGLASANEYHWQGAGTGGNTAADPADPTTRWSRPDNWAEGTVPLASDTAYLALTNPGEVHLLFDEVDRLYIDGPSDEAALRFTGTCELEAAYVYAGYSQNGRIVQDGGWNLAQRLTLGENAGASGSYELRGGTLGQCTLYVGKSGVGRFIQTGGLARPGMILGCEATGEGTYELQDGFFVVGSFSVASRGTGTFIQTGGVNQASQYVWMAYESGSTAEYRLHDGVFSITSDSDDDRLCVGRKGTARFLQTGGRLTVGDRLTLGDYESGHGTFELQDGHVSSYITTVGSSGTGEFVQTGGSHSVRNRFYLGVGETARGTYVLHDGNLTVGYAESIGLGGAAEFVQWGGTHVAHNHLYLGDSNGSGTLTQHGGKFQAGHLYLRGGATNQGTYNLNGGNATISQMDVGVEGPGLWNITNPAAEVSILSKLHFGLDAHLTAAPGTTIHMVAADLVNECMDETSLAGLMNIQFVFEGGTDDDGCAFEVAGADLGPVADGFCDNFVAGGLVVGGDSPALVRLTDAEDNGNRSSAEALYLYDLEVGHGSTLDLAGLKVYYGHTFVNQGTVVGGVPVYVPEPATLGFALLGAAYLLLVRRHRGGGRAARRAAALALLTLAAAGTAAHADEETNWRCPPGTTGSWNAAANWDAGVPTSSLDAVIDNGGTARVASGTAKASELIVGRVNSGTLIQTGGTTSLDWRLWLAYAVNSEGTYELRQGNLSSKGALIGYRGDGHFIHTGGKYTVTDYYMSMARVPVAVATYDLSGSGILNNKGLTLGHSGEAVFRQAGGTHTVSTELQMGQDFLARGRYELSGGTLDVKDLTLGVDGVGVFAQTGGLNRTAYLLVSERSRYELYGGTLQLTEGGLVNGPLDFGGGTAQLKLDAGILDLTPADIRDPSMASYLGGANSLLIVSPDFDPYTGFRSLITSGLVHVPGQTLLVPQGKGFTGTGTVRGHVINEGTIKGDRYPGINIAGGLMVRKGSVSLSGMYGVLTVENEISGLQQGEIYLGYTNVGLDGTGRFVQTGGTHEVLRDVRLGTNTGSSGVYELRGGMLDATHLYVGGSGNGRFIQTGGEASDIYSLSVGGAADTYSSYELSGAALLSASYRGVGGGGGEALFDQSGGTNSGKSLSIRSNGLYELRGGTLSASSVTVTGADAARFRQTGGTSTASEITIATSREHQGTYELVFGKLTAESECIGDEGVGTFIQSGGTNTVEGTVSIGAGSGSDGTYELSGGGLSARSLSIAASYYGHGTGSFQQTGGTCTLTDGLNIGGSRNTNHGLYSISAGILRTDDIKVGDGGNGTFAIDGSTARTVVANLLYLGSASTFTAVPDAVILMTGHAFENESTREDALSGLENLWLSFSMGTPADWATFEVAGTDLDAEMVGFHDNFDLGTLAVGRGPYPGRVRLVDDFNNGNRGGPGGSAEALYLHSLTVETGSVLDLNGFHVYYDGTFVNHGTVLNGVPVFVPEPATLALLAVGGLSLVLRRRR